MAKRLRNEPMAFSLTKDREWFIKWLIEVPDISITLCPNLLGDMGKNKERGGEIIASMMASQAEYRIVNGAKGGDEAMYMAGVEGALATYEALRKQDSKYEVKNLNELLKKRDDGALRDHVNKTRNKHCSSRN